MLAHLSAIIAWVVSAGWISFVGPFLVWFLKKDNPYVRQAAAQSFNFNLGMWAMSLISWILTITLIRPDRHTADCAELYPHALAPHQGDHICASNNHMHHYPYQIKILHADRSLRHPRPPSGHARIYMGKCIVAARELLGRLLARVAQEFQRLPALYAYPVFP